MTRDELGNILSAGMATKTMHMWNFEKDQRITDEWIVVLITTDENGVLNIYCEAPQQEGGKTQ